MSKLFQTLLGILVIVVLPLAWNIDLFLTWPVLCTVIAGALVHMNAPETDISELWKPNPHDRWATHLMILSASAFTSVSLLDYAYFRQARPSILSFWSFVGLGSMSIGLLLRWWTIRTLGHFFTARVHLSDEHEIIDIGPYRRLKIRHPAYTGTFFVSLGIPIVLRSYWGLLVYAFFMIPVYLYRISVEESALRIKFGSPYEEFSKRTYKILPYLY